MIDLEKAKGRIAEKTKDELMELARNEFGKSIDLTDKVENIRDSVLKWYEEKANLIMKGCAVGKDRKLPKYLKNPVTGHIFGATLALLQRGDLVACGKNGEPIK